MKAVQVFDGDGTRPGIYAVSDGIVLSSARLCVPKRMAKKPWATFRDNEWVEVFVNSADYRAIMQARDGIKTIYIPRQYRGDKRMPLILKDIRSEPYRYATHGRQHTFIVKCSTIRAWESMPGFDIRLWSEHHAIYPDEVRAGS